MDIFIGSVRYLLSIYLRVVNYVVNCLQMYNEKRKKSIHSQCELHGGASIPDVRQTGVCCTALDNSPVSPCRRTEMQLDHLVELFSCLPVRGCTINGHISGASAKEAMPTTQIQSTERSAYDDSDWSRRNPNRALGMEVFRTGTTCAEYCAYIRATSFNDWPVSNRPAVKPIVVGSPTDFYGTHVMRIQRGSDFVLNDSKTS